MFEDIILLTTYKNIKKIIFNHIDILIDVRIIFLDAREEESFQERTKNFLIFSISFLIIRLINYKFFSL